MNIAYIRVSSVDQNERRQIEALKKFNIDNGKRSFQLNLSKLEDLSLGNVALTHIITKQMINVLIKNQTACSK